MDRNGMKQGLYIHGEQAKGGGNENFGPVVLLAVMSPKCKDSFASCCLSVANSVFPCPITSDK
jgi:hypothetical protein